MNIGETELHTTILRHSQCIAEFEDNFAFRDAQMIGHSCLKKAKPTTKRFNAQKHLRWTMVGPDSSYSCLEIHICWNVLNEDKKEPPIHTEYLRSGGATTLIFIVDGARAVNSFVIRSPTPWNMVVPPERTTFAYRSLRISTSHFMMDWNVVSWMPLASFPMKLGWKRTSGQRKRSLPTVMILPSGSSYVFSLSELSEAAFISESKSSAM